MELLLVVVTLLALSADARPQFKRLQHKAMHSKRQDSNAACTRASDNLVALLDMHDMWDPTVPTEPGAQDSFEEFMNLVSPIDVSNAAARETYVCSFDDQTTVSEAVATLDELGSIEHIVSVMYAYMVYGTRVEKWRSMQTLENPPAWMDEAQQKLTELLVQFITDLEASGFLSFEQDEAMMFLELLVPYMTDYTPAPPSSLPLEQQCSVTANDARQLWNHAVKHAEQWNPGHGDQMRETIREWTGVEFGTHGQMRGLICTVMEAVVNDGPQGLYEFLMAGGVPEQVATTGYPHLLQGVAMLRQHIDHELQPPVNGLPYYYTYYHHPETIELYTVLKDLLDNVEEMGLFSLE